MLLSIYNSWIYSPFFVWTKVWGASHLPLHTKIINIVITIIIDMIEPNFWNSPMGCGGGGTQEIINNRASNATCLNIDGIIAFHQSKSTMINGTVDAEDYGNLKNLNLSRDSFVTRLHQPTTADHRKGGRDRYSSSYGTQVPNLMSYDDQVLSLNK